MNDISVITICFNNLADVQHTCLSVDAQTLLPAEHWIINGSTESAIENWLTQTPQPFYRKWINERDLGIADAFNKGIANAKYEWLHLLNAGDTYASADVLSSVTAFIKRHNEVQWISGNMQMMRGRQKVTIGKPFDSHQIYKGMRSVSHPTLFVKRQLYSRVGGFNLSYKIAMDYDLMCRLVHIPYAYFNKTLVVFDDTGISTDKYLAALAESKKIYKSYFGHSILMEAWQLRLKILYYLLKTRPGKWLFGIKKKMGLENY